MAWRVSKDASFGRLESTSFWNAIEPVFDAACPIAPLPRDDDGFLDASYIVERKGDSFFDVKAMYSRLPREFENFRLGPTEIDLLDFCLMYGNDRFLNLVGPRGSGKTSLIHRIESVGRRAAPTNYPIFLILNCLSIPKEAIVSDFVSLLVDEIGARLDHMPQQYRVALRRASQQLRKSPSLQTVRGVVRKVTTDLGIDETRRLIIVFDNLDQLLGHVIAHALEVAKEIYLSGRIACIVCLRPGSMIGSFGRGDARAIANYSIAVSAPTSRAWLSALCPRLIGAAKQYEETTRRPFRAYEIDFGPDSIGRVVEALINDLGKRRAPDDAIRVLDAVSADDTRHLVRLVRRIFSHRDLPADSYLGLAAAREFHPLRAMIEGQYRWFTGDVYVPNLLCFHGREGNSDFLLSHRLLTLLNDRDACETHQLIRWAEELGYSRVNTIECLDMLHRSLLVRTAGVDFIDEQGALPGQIHISAAGNYYINHLIRFTDYLIVAVVDVPLEHKVLKELVESQTVDDAFRGRFASLLEYAEEVRQREEAQMRLLSKREPSANLRRVADSLRMGGTLTQAMADGLRSAIERGRHSTAVSVQRGVVAQEPAVKRLESWTESAERRFGELVNRGRRSAVVPQSAVRQSEGPAEVAVRSTSLGDDMQLEVDVRSSEPYDSVIVGVSGEINGERFYRATLARPKRNNHERSSNDLGTTSFVGKFRELPNTGIRSVDHLASHAIPISNTGLGHDRIALLCADEESQNLRLRFYRPGPFPGVDIGRDCKASDIQEWASEQLRNMSGKVIGDESFTDLVAEIGTDLAARVLTTSGQNTLASVYNLIDTLIIFAGDNNMIVPWEWLRPPPRPGDQLRVIGDVWRTIRWPADRFEGMLLLKLADRALSVVPSLTFGLDGNKKFPWRIKAPKSLEKLVDLASNSRMIHLVGHYENDTLNVRADLKIRSSTAKAFPFNGPQSIVISSCSAASASIGANIAAEIAKASQCVVWAPLVHISEQDADMLDQKIHEYCRDKKDATMETFMENMRDEIPLLRLYVRYGIHQ